MKLVTYRTPQGHARAGAIAGERVVDLAAGAALLGETLPADLLGILTLEDRGLATARQVVAEAEAGRLPGWAPDQVTLLAALPRPPKLLLLAGNYQAHITESGAARVDKAAITPRFFIKPGTAVIGTGDTIKIPPVSDKVDYELEIAAVIGRRGRAIALADAQAYVAGYVVFNDVSARELSIVGHRQPRPMDDFFDWLNGKWCDTFAAIGPYLVTAGEMIFSVPESIAFIAQFITLEPGDLICMGTPGGVGDTTETYLQPCDLFEAEIEKLGRLVNHVA
jgi:2-keto-4-pentenoate hydratase/2-oxohepta-3-ene-1,7-dioic acid hydratase in catechol pathway